MDNLLTSMYTEAMRLETFTIRDTRGWKWDVKAEGKSSAYDIWKEQHPDRTMLLINSESEEITHSLERCGE